MFTDERRDKIIELLQKTAEYSPRNSRIGLNCRLIPSEEIYRLWRRKGCSNVRMAAQYQLLKSAAPRSRQTFVIKRLPASRCHIEISSFFYTRKGYCIYRQCRHPLRHVKVSS